MPKQRHIRYDFLKINGRIDSFTNEYECFDMNYQTEFTYFGSKWSSVKQAYDSLIEEGFDTHRKLNLMGNILYHCYKQNDDMAAVLLNTKAMWLQNTVKNHDNFWHNCVCIECFTELGENYYGRLLMEVRDRLIWEKKTTGNKRWAKRYF